MKEREIEEEGAGGAVEQEWTKFDNKICILSTIYAGIYFLWGEQFENNYFNNIEYNAFFVLFE